MSQRSLQILRVEGTNTRNKRQRWGDADILRWKIGHHDDKSQRWAREMGGGRGRGGLYVLYSLLCRHFNHRSHFCFAAVNCRYGNCSVDYEKKKDGWWTRLKRGRGLGVVDINMLHFMTLLSHCLHPVLTQRAHYCQRRGVDLRRHSYERRLKALLYTHSPSVND